MQSKLFGFCQVTCPHRRIGKIVTGKIQTTYRRILHTRQNNPAAAVQVEFELMQLKTKQPTTRMCRAGQPTCSNMVPADCVYIISL
ncbi:hypothetical protein GALMADRAFT_786287 [Galerina marginata CBS 339.88]|uniref:Uncharacterized protein n=1 Tax=Galerina marginata (strain CBS 339.88) TaxID=685588 RepID=A0A067SUT6_GALM3|nr:hypothetical protein GALMADRAFT_786287 [Galerina marginata CBS 339.88]